MRSLSSACATFVAFGLERLHFLFQFGVARFQLFHARQDLSSVAASAVRRRGRPVRGGERGSATRVIGVSSVAALLADADVGEFVFDVEGLEPRADAGGAVGVAAEWACWLADGGRMVYFTLYLPGPASLMLSP